MIPKYNKFLKRANLKLLKSKARSVRSRSIRVYYLNKIRKEFAPHFFPERTWSIKLKKARNSNDYFSFSSIKFNIFLIR